MVKAYHVEKWLPKLPGLWVYTLFSLVAASQLLVYSDNLPRGFELAKVHGIQFIGALSLMILPWILFINAYYQGVVFRKQILQRFPVLIILALLFIVLVLGAVFSPYSNTAFEGSYWRGMGVVTIGAIMIIDGNFLLFVQKEHLKTLAIIFLLIGMVHLGFGVADIWKFREQITSSGDYINGRFGQANFYAASVLAQIIVVSFFIWQSIKAKQRLLASLSTVYLGLCLGVLMATQSRGGIAVLIYLILAVAISCLARNRHNLRLTLLLITALVFGSVLVHYTYNNDLSRQMYWQETWGMIADRPILGYGSDTMLSVSQSKQAFNGRYVDRAHNLFLDVLFNYGLVGAVIILLLVGYILWGVSKNGYDRRQELLLFLLLAFILTGLVHTKSVYHYTEVMVILTLLAATNRGTGSWLYK